MFVTRQVKIMFHEKDSSHISSVTQVLFFQATTMLGSEQQDCMCTSHFLAQNIKMLYIQWSGLNKINIFINSASSRTFFMELSLFYGKCMANGTVTGSRIWYHCLDLCKRDHALPTSAFLPSLQMSLWERSAAPLYYCRHCLDHTGSPSGS